MAPKFAPKVWKRPYTSIYNDNYRYGNSLYSDAITDIEKKYSEAMANTRLRFDRPDLNLSTFADSQLIGESAIRQQRSSAANESFANERMRSISMTRVNNYLEDSERKLAQSPSYDTYSSQRAIDRIDRDIEESRLRRSNSRRSVRRPDSVMVTPTNAYESALLNANDNNSGHSQAFMTERCRELQSELDQIKLEINATEDKVKHESSVLKNKVNQDVADLVIALEDQDRQIADLQKMLRRQAKQVSDISLELDASQRQFADVNDTLQTSQRRVLNMCHEIEDVRANLEKQHIRRNPPRLPEELQRSCSIPRHYNSKRDPRFVID